MPRRRDKWISSIKAVEEEYLIARLAMTRLTTDAGRDPTVVPGKGTKDIQKVAELLEGTYLIRLFAEFEAGLRQFWRTAKPTNPPAESLINGIRRMQRIHTNLSEPAHFVRKYRNALVHDREEGIPSVSLNDACAHLCRFFARLPPDWP